jgi:hypothetical protein
MSGYINHGRNIVFDKNSEDIHALQRSEILDQTTCNFCLSVDGRVVEKDDPFAQSAALPLKLPWYLGSNPQELLTIGGIPSLRDRVTDAVNDHSRPKKPTTRKNTPTRVEGDRRNYNKWDGPVPRDVQVGGSRPSLPAPPLSSGSTQGMKHR